MRRRDHAVSVVRDSTKPPANGLVRSTGLGVPKHPKMIEDALRAAGLMR